jgi:hypothetical protein
MEFTLRHPVYMSDNEHVDYMLIAILYRIENFCLFGQMFVSCITYDRIFSQHKWCKKKGIHCSAEVT